MKFGNQFKWLTTCGNHIINGNKPSFVIKASWIMKKFVEKEYLKIMIEIKRIEEEMDWIKKYFIMALIDFEDKLYMRGIKANIFNSIDSHNWKKDIDDIAKKIVQINNKKEKIFIG